MSLVSEVQFLSERLLTPFSEWISDDPELNLFWDIFRVYSFKASNEQLATKAPLHCAAPFATWYREIFNNESLKSVSGRYGALGRNCRSGGKIGMSPPPGRSLSLVGAL